MTPTDKLFAMVGALEETLTTLIGTVERLLTEPTDRATLQAIAIDLRGQRKALTVAMAAISEAGR